MGSPYGPVASKATCCGQARAFDRDARNYRAPPPRTGFRLLDERERHPMQQHGVFKLDDTSNSPASLQISKAKPMVPHCQSPGRSASMPRQSLRHRLWQSQKLGNCIGRSLSMRSPLPLRLK